MSDFFAHGTRRVLLTWCPRTDRGHMSIMRDGVNRTYPINRLRYDRIWALLRPGSRWTGAYPVRGDMMDMLSGVYPYSFTGVDDNSISEA